MKAGYELTDEEKRIAFPCLYAQLVPSEKVVFNEYNPNTVAPPEMKLLATSILADGYTQPVVTIYDAEKDVYTVIDGAHRKKNGTDVFKLPMIPVVVLNKTMAERMASTIRHNRARGEHGVTQMSSIVAELILLGLSDAKVGKELGMSADEVLRLKQNTGIAAIFQSKEYSKSWDVK